MNLIPVIDLARGHAVHATGGLRESYQPLQSILCHCSEPLAVVKGLLDLYPFTCLYIADLDAIQGRPVQSSVLRHLREAFPALQLWIDAGIRDTRQFRALARPAHVTPVLGSETLIDTGLLEQLADHDSAILSLDFQDRSFLGPATLLDRPALWPRQVIAMTLDRVGNNLGPDLQRLRQLRNAAPAAQLYAAGGVRSADDLHALQAAGCAGVLLASALHDGRVSARRIADFA